MRKLVTFSLLATLAVSAAGTAWAVTVPGLPTGYLYDKSRNEDMGSTYVVSALNPGDEFSFNPAGLVGGVPTAVLGTYNGIPTIKTVTKIQATGALPSNGAGSPLEDTWGIALLYQVAPGHINNPGADGSIIGFTGPITYDNSAGDKSTWMTIMFHGGVDTFVDVIQGSGTGGGGNGIPVGQQKETINTSGVKAELYAVDSAAMDAAIAGAPKDSVNLVDYLAASRLAADQYLGWTGNTLPAINSVLLLSGLVSDYQQGTVVVDATGTIVSNSLNASNVYMHVPVSGGGMWNPYLSSNQLLTPDSIPTDLWFQWTLDNGQRDWAIHSNDIGGAFSSIPEPMTLMGAFLGISGVCGYLRRRSRTA